MKQRARFCSSINLHSISSWHHSGGGDVVGTAFVTDKKQLKLFNQHSNNLVQTPNRKAKTTNTELFICKFSFFWGVSGVFRISRAHLRCVVLLCSREKRIDKINVHQLIVVFSVLCGGVLLARAVAVVVVVVIVAVVSVVAVSKKVAVVFLTVLMHYK